MDPRDEMETGQLEMLQQAFCEQLMACLDECARGRKGLFGDVALLNDEGEGSAWPEAARLRELAWRCNDSGAAGRAERVLRRVP